MFKRALIPPPPRHYVSQVSYQEAPPEGLKRVLFGMGCFWGAERLFWKTPGVWRTAVGYAGGELEHPCYREVCSKQSGHAEVVEVYFDPAKVSFDELLRLFWESHDPTQGDRQGNDVGPQYRSVIFAPDEALLQIAEQSKAAYQSALQQAQRGQITTQIAGMPTFYFAESDHQQYLAKNPQGYCGLRGTGVACSIPPQAP